MNEPTTNAMTERNATATLDHDRLDAAILRSLGKRRSLRDHRMSPVSTVWDKLELNVMQAATTLWELPILTPVGEDLLAFCAYLAREIEVTESLDIDSADEWERLQELAPGALAALDEISITLADASADTLPTERSLARAFGEIRAELATASRFAWAIAA